MLSAIPLDIGPDGLLGVEQSNKTAVFSKRQQQDSHPLWGEGNGIGAPHCCLPLLSAEQEPWVSRSLRKRWVSSKRAVWEAGVASQLAE